MNEGNEIDDAAAATEAGEAGPLPAGKDAAPDWLSSEALLQGRRMVEIRHNGEVYRLQATRLGKLILTK